MIYVMSVELNKRLKMEETKKEIFVNISALNYKDLKNKFPSVNIDEIIEKKVKYFRLKPFKNRTKVIWIEQIKDYLELVNEDFKEEEKSKFSEASKVFSLKGQSEIFNEIQPVFYDKSGLWWLWNDNIKCWELSDEVDILNMIQKNTGKDVITSKNRQEIINALKQEGRLNIPKSIKKTWIQFKDTIVDVENGEEFKASPEYFVTNPIPWNLHEDRFVNTPIMDRIFEEWVGKEHIKTLYEIMAYVLLPSYPIHRLFCLIGSGMNGKSCFLNLIRKFIGEKNITSTELDTLLSSRFEVTRLYKKLVCIMGETNFSEMNKTSIIKKLTGQDIIGFEYKNKTPFEDINYSKILIATNNLPTTTDKTIGFYRRWLILDFPNQFNEKKDILNDIPEEEYRSLAVKCLGILKELLEKREFTNEGTIEQRQKKYDDHSDPLEKFMKEYTYEDVDGFIWKYEFEKKLNEWCKENRFRQMSEVVIGKKMKEKNVLQEYKQTNWLVDGIQKRYRAWIGVKWKDNVQDNLDVQLIPT
jgi:P4 family phage/plasmid primase-like protien